jgi:hypothetical protein
MADIKHVSAKTGESFDTLEELLAAESNGWMVIAVVTNGKKTWPAAEGPYPLDKKEATKAAARLRARWKRTARNYPGITYKIHIRPAWKSLY